MNSIESPVVLAPLPLDEADSLFPAFDASDPDALNALRSLIAAPQHQPAEVKKSPLAPSSGSMPEENDALQVLCDEAETFFNAHEPVAHFISSRKSPFTSSPTSVPTDSWVTDLEVIVAAKSTAPSPLEKSDVELSSEPSSPGPALIEALRALFVTPGQASPAVQTQIIPDEGKDIGSMRMIDLLQSLLSEERLPVAYLPLLAQVRDALAQTKGDLNHQPEALAQIRALIETMPPEAGPVTARPPIQTKESPSARPLDVSSDLSPDLDKTEQEMTAQKMPNLGQAILQSLDSQSSASAANGIAAVNQPAHLERVEQVSALMTEMADRVLVTDPLHGQTQEVRIQFAESIMPGTEVRVWREEGGQLRVDFDTTSGYWARVLSEASPLLSQRLNERLNLPEAVIVNVHQQGGQPEDGRSRNRHTPWEMTGQEDPQ